MIVVLFLVKHSYEGSIQIQEYVNEIIKIMLSTFVIHANICIMSLHLTLPAVMDVILFCHDEPPHKGD